MNGYPTLQLVLNPGGCADFLFPVSGGQQSFFLTPGRKDGDVRALKTPLDKRCKYSHRKIEIVLACFDSYNLELSLLALKAAINSESCL